MANYELRMPDEGFGAWEAGCLSKSNWEKHRVYRQKQIAIEITKVRNQKGKNEAKIKAVHRSTVGTGKILHR